MADVGSTCVEAGKGSERGARRGESHGLAGYSEWGKEGVEDGEATAPVGRRTLQEGDTRKVERRRASLSQHRLHKRRKCVQLMFARSLLMPFHLCLGSNGLLVAASEARPQVQDALAHYVYCSRDRGGRVESRPT